MPDDLRTRIAAALHKHLLAVLDDDWITCRCDDYLSRFTVETYERHVADAVIRELNISIIEGIDLHRVIRWQLLEGIQWLTISWRSALTCSKPAGSLTTNF